MRDANAGQSEFAGQGESLRPHVLPALTTPIDRHHFVVLQIKDGRRVLRGHHALRARRRQSASMSQRLASMARRTPLTAKQLRTIVKTSCEDILRLCAKEVKLRRWGARWR